MSRYSSKYAKLTSMEALFDWFADLSLPYWTLYRDFQGERKNRSYAISQNDRDIPIEQSWEILEKNIEMQSQQGGCFTVYVSDKPRGNYGYTTFLEFSNPLSVSQVSGLPAVQDGIGTMIPGGIQGFIAGQINTAKKELELNYEIQKLREENDYLKTQEPETFKERLLEPFIQDPMGILEKVMGIIALLKNPGSTAIKQVAGGPPVGDHDPVEGQQLSPEEYTSRIAAARDRIQQHIDMMLLLENVAAAIEGNPEKVAALLCDKEKLINLTKLL